jgi:hypothetical protein
MVSSFIAHLTESHQRFLGFSNFVNDWLVKSGPFQVLAVFGGVSSFLASKPFSF